MREFLKGLELDKETINAIMAEHGKLITESKEEIGALKAQNKELSNEVAKNKEIDIEAIKKAEYEKGKSEGSQEVETFKKSFALKEAIKNSKAKDIDLLLKMIDNDKISYEVKDGKYEIGGLTEQVENIKKTHDYLFEPEKKAEKEPERINAGDNHSQESNKPTSLLDALKEKFN